MRMPLMIASKNRAWLSESSPTRALAIVSIGCRRQNGDPEGNSVPFNSCSNNTSGSRAFSHVVTWVRRERTEFKFQLATLNINPHSSVMGEVPPLSTGPLQEESILNLCKLHWRGASLVIVQYGIDPSAHGIAPHQPSIAGFQQFGRRSHILHPRIEPEIVRIRIKDDWHAVMDWCGHSIRGRGQDRAGLD